ncbi:flagellar hook-basal body protein [Thiomicrospira aerophila AL3]|uniref:Flagellar basal-body rod protein FlgF n=2 Tax=Thiomicrospira aerophila TaxID=92245 RepID=W0DWE8_9GAMM|nr:flagellar hook-basal body protein [Thiomicrospira aerophila AL3]
MDRMLFIAMSGAKEVAFSQANNANNLANANTDGFMQDFNQFRAQLLQGPGWESRTYSMDERPATDFTPGAIKVTGRPLDVTTNGDGFFAVLNRNQDEAYVRSASLQVTEAGLLVDVKGQPVLNAAGGQIALPPYDDVAIGSDGTISLIPAGAGANEWVVIDQLRLVSPPLNQLMKDLDGSVRLVAGAELPEQANVPMVSGALQTSNVNTVQALTTMIELSRKYEMQVKMMKTASDLASSTNQILSIRG